MRRYGYPVGELAIVDDGEAVVGVAFLADGAPDGLQERETDLIREAHRQLSEYFRRERTKFELPIRLKGSKFQHRVWEALFRIPYGETMSYIQLAGELGCPEASGAVAATLVGNPAAIVVPSHRVVGAGGGLIGQESKFAVKRYLLDLERSGCELPVGESRLNMYERECARFVRERVG